MSITHILQGLIYLKLTPSGTVDRLKSHFSSLDTLATLLRDTGCNGEENDIHVRDIRKNACRWYESLHGEKSKEANEFIKTHHQEALKIFLTPQEDMFGGFIPDWIVLKKYVVFKDNTNPFGIYVALNNCYGEALCNYYKKKYHIWNDISVVLERHNIFEFSSPEQELLIKHGLNTPPKWLRVGNNMSESEREKWRDDKLFELHRRSKAIQISQEEMIFLKKYKQ